MHFILHKKSAENTHDEVRIQQQIFFVGRGEVGQGSFYQEIPVGTAAHSGDCKQDHQQAGQPKNAFDDFEFKQGYDRRKGYGG